MCHVNMMKLYHSREDRNKPSTSSNEKATVSPVDSFSKVSSSDDGGLVVLHATPQGARLSNTEGLSNSSHLPDDQRNDVEKLICDVPCLINDIPSQTSVIAHDIVLTNPMPIKQHANRVSPTEREVMKKDIDYLLKIGFTVPSSSPWSSPCLLDAKSNESLKMEFCNCP